MAKATKAKKKTEKVIRLSPTPFDDAFRTLMGNCPRLVLFLINEIFGEHFTGNERLIDRDGNFFPLTDYTTSSKIITDSRFSVEGAPDTEYHIECQSDSDKDMIVRMIQYDVEMAVKKPDKGYGYLKIRMPKSAVIFLRKESAAPDEWMVSVIPPSGNEKEALVYPIPAIKLLDYTEDELFEKRLYFLCPFYLFAYEKEIRGAKSDKDADKALKHADRLAERLIKTGDVTPTEVSFLYEAMKKIMLQFSKGNKVMKKGVEEHMGGRILPTMTAKARDEGVSQGISQGKIQAQIDSYQSARQEGIDRDVAIRISHISPETATAVDNGIAVF